MEYSSARPPSAILQPCSVLVRANSNFSSAIQYRNSATSDISSHFHLGSDLIFNLTFERYRQDNQVRGQELRHHGLSGCHGTLSSQAPGQKSSSHLASCDIGPCPMCRFILPSMGLVDTRHNMTYKDTRHPKRELGCQRNRRVIAGGTGEAID